MISLSLSRDKASPRIAIFLPSLSGGGAERVMVTLANAFAEQGYAVDLVLAKVGGPYLSQVSDAVRVVDLKAGRVIIALWPLLRYLRREEPVAMLSAMTHANLVAILARILARTPKRLVVSERSTITEELRVSHGLVARILYVLVRFLYPHVDSIVAVSKASAADLIRFADLPTSTVSCIYNPFDLSRIQAHASEPIDHPWFASGQPPVILAIGRLTEQKDFSSLLRAFARIRASRVSRLLILGEGELRGKLEAQVAKLGLSADDVQMPGFVTNPFAYLARCAVFVLSSRWEGLPGVLIEALACGAQVVSTDCPSGPQEILEGGKWGHLVPVGNVEDMSNAIEIVLDFPREQLPDVRRRAADFEQEKAVDAYLKVLGLPSQVHKS